MTGDPAAAGGVVQRTRLAAYAWCEADDAVLLCRLAHGRRPTAAPGRCPAAASSSARTRRAASCASSPRRRATTPRSTASRGSARRSASPTRRRAATASSTSAILYRATVTGGELRDEVGRLDRPRRVGPARRRLDALPAGRTSSPGPAATDGPLSDALDHRHRRRRAARARLPPRPRRHALGAAAPPLRPLPGRPARRPTAPSCATSSRGGSSSRGSGVGDPGRLAQPDLARAGDAAAAVPPRGRRDQGHGRDLDDRARGRRARASRSSTTSDPACPGSPPSSTARSRARSPAGRWRRCAPSPRRSTATRLPAANPADGRRDADVTPREVWITGHRRDLGDRDRAAGVPRRPAGERVAGQAHRPLRPVAVPVAGRGPGRRLRARRPHGRAGGPRRSTGSASSASRRGAWRWPTPGSCRAWTAAPDGERIGIYLGSALGGIAFAEAQHEKYLDARPARRVPHPRARGVRRGGAGQPRHRARRPRADPVDRQLVRVRRGRDRRGAGRDPGRRDRRRDRGRRRVPAVAARVRRVRPHPRPGPRPQRRPGARLAADGRRARRVRHGRGRRRCSCWRPRTSPGGAAPGPTPRSWATAPRRTPTTWSSRAPTAARRRARSGSRSRTPASRADEIDWVSAHALVDADRRHRGGARDRGRRSGDRAPTVAGERDEGR